jgi:hypothetical protein
MSFLISELIFGVDIQENLDIRPTLFSTQVTMNYHPPTTPWMDVGEDRKMIYQIA